MKKLLLLFGLLAAIPSLGQNKMLYDLQQPGLHKSGAGTSWYEGYMLTRSISECSMLSGGYFTVATNKGLASSRLDNLCSITFGHPYALTSYPMLMIDGEQYKPDELFDVLQLTPKQRGDTLEMVAVKTNLCRYAFQLIMQQDGSCIEIAAKIENLDVVNHRFGLATVFDPALGLWGDGCVSVSGKDLYTDTLFTAVAVPPYLLIWERMLGAKGLGIELAFSPQPDQLALGNWRDIENRSTATVRTLYDATLKWNWLEKEMLPAGQLHTSCSLTLLSPDFSSKVFLRSDLPQFFSMENKELYPRNVKSVIQVANTTANDLNELHVEFEVSEKLALSGSATSFSVLSGQTGYRAISVDPKFCYEDMVAPAAVLCKQGTEIVDQLVRWIYLPAAVLSDSGLAVTIDTVKTDKYPQVSVCFSAEVSSTGQKLYDLRKENIFLYENDLRINDFTLGLDVASTASQADIVFVLDVTGSMSDEIQAVCDNIRGFAANLAASNIDYRLGMVTFLDEIENVYPFTTDVNKFKDQVSQQYAHGGGDGPENSLQALQTAGEFSFRPGCKRLFVWITDADYHEQDWATPLSRQPVLTALLNKDIIVYAIGRLMYKTGFYDPFVNPTGGKYFDITGNFQDILNEIANIKANRYVVAYNSKIAAAVPHKVKLELHYGGLGGFAETSFSQSSAVVSAPALRCYPNPFNPVITISVHDLRERSADVAIYNLLGERVRCFHIESGRQSAALVWDSRNEAGMGVSTGMYFVELLLQQPRQRAVRQVERILYLK